MISLASALVTASCDLVRFRTGTMAGRNDAPPAPFHAELSRIGLAGKHHAGITAFRESGKTEYLVRVLPVHRLVFGAAEYIVIVRSSLRLAEKALSDIVAAVRDNPLLSRLVSFTKVTASAVEAAGLGGSVRIEAFGKGSSLRGLTHRGLRPSHVIIDDVQDTADMLSPAAQDRDWAWFMSDVVYLSSAGRIIVIGNALGEHCLIERIFAAAEELSFTTLRIPAVNEDGVPAWPAKLPVGEIERRRRAAEKTGAAASFERELMCRPVADGELMFAGAKPKVVDDVDTRDCLIYAAVDVAIGQSDHHDRSAVAVIAVDAKNAVTLLEIRTGRWNPSELIDRIFAVAEAYEPAAVAIETVAWQAALVHLVMRRMPVEETFFRVIPVTPKGNKTMRIAGLIQPRLATDTLTLKNGDWVDDFLFELTRFPKAPHDDMLDALAHAIAVSEPPAPKRTAPLPAYSAT